MAKDGVKGGAPSLPPISTQRGYMDKVNSEREAQGKEPLMLNESGRVATLESGNERLSPPEKIWFESQQYTERKRREREAEAELKSKLGDADEDEGADEDDGGAPERDASGRFRPKKKETTKEAGDEPVEGDVEMQRIRLAMIRSGWTESELDAMPKETLRKRGLKRLAALNADDEAHNFMREALKEPGRGGKTDNQQEGAPPAKLEPVDVAPLVSPLAARLGLDGEGASDLKQFAEKLVETITKRTEQQLTGSLDGFAKAQVANAAQQLFVSAQAGVGKRFPDVLDPKTFASAVALAGSLAGDKSVMEQVEREATPQARANQLLERACKALGLDEQARESDIEARRERTLRQHSRTSVGNRGAARLTPQQQTRQRFDESMDRHGL